MGQVAPCINLDDRMALGTVARIPPSLEREELHVGLSFEGIKVAHGGCLICGEGGDLLDYSEWALDALPGMQGSNKKIASQWLYPCASETPDDQTFSLQLQRVPAEVQYLFFVGTLQGHGVSFRRASASRSRITRPQLAIAAAQERPEICAFRRADFSDGNGIIIMALYREPEPQDPEDDSSPSPQSRNWIAEGIGRCYHIFDQAGPMGLAGKPVEALVAILGKPPPKTGLQQMLEGRTCEMMREDMEDHARAVSVPTDLGSKGGVFGYREDD